MIYLRTIFSAPNEIKFLKLNLQESWNFVDKFVICEFNRTHTGDKRELIFEKYLDQFTAAEKEKIIYIGADVSEEVLYSRDNKDLSLKNNHIMLGYFAKKIDLADDDIVFAVDADEIICEEYYGEIIREIDKRKWPWQKKSLVLPIRVFFYKINYLWENNKFFAPVACRASAFKNKKLATWRYSGVKYNKFVGCHFSWCLTIDEMIRKLNIYAHQKEYGSFANREVLEDAVKNKKYPFDPSVDFKIRVLDINKDIGYYPKSIYRMLDQFKEFIA